jgi:hypothetical protein
MRPLVLSLIILLSLSAAALPTEDSIGPGVQVGTQGALTLKYFFTDEDAVNGGVEFMDHAWSVFFADYIRHFPRLFGKGTRFGRESSLYLGVGAGGGFWDRTDHCGRWRCHWNAGSTGTGNGFFVRAVLGLEWYPKATHFSVFAEAAPSFMWYPTNGSATDFVLGGRYYF